MFGKTAPALTVICVIITLSLSRGKVQHEPGTPLPTFGDPIGNATVVKGRDVTFTCIVKHLGKYKVGWVKADTKAIQAIHHQVVTHNSRVSVTYRDHTTWNLHIKNVQEDDNGVYMCQVNTDPMISMMAHLKVVVPPEIIDNETSPDLDVLENRPATIKCKAQGSPEPEIKWQREDGKKLSTSERGAKKASTSGNTLHIPKVTKEDMGPYLCIAKNSVPPSVSKRIMLSVNFAPRVTVPLHMIGSQLGYDVTLECNIESSPKPVITWRKEPDSQMIISDTKYEVFFDFDKYYNYHTKLTIKDFSKTDITKYTCGSSNSIGESESTIRVYELPPQKATLAKVENDKSRISNKIPTIQDGNTKRDYTLFPEEDDRRNSLLDNYSSLSKAESANGVKDTEKAKRKGNAISKKENSRTFFSFGNGGNSCFINILTKFFFILYCLCSLF